VKGSISMKWLDSIASFAAIIAALLLIAGSLTALSFIVLVEVASPEECLKLARAIYKIGFVFGASSLIIMLFTGTCRHVIGRSIITNHQPT
tara:strand:- start:188 stop:460 length:273 start_codon:yes stop_codon:yes gene_type:complete